MVNIVKVEQFKEALKSCKNKLTADYGGHTVKFFFGKVKTGFGVRNYFICPVCGQYRVTLVWNGKMFLCFKCAGINPYEGIQKSTRGGDEFLLYKMERYAHKRGVEGFHFPFWYGDYERPKRYNQAKWETTMKVLQALEGMRCLSIFFGKIWDAKTIQSVENGTNPHLSRPILHLALYWYPYDGIPVDTSKFAAGAYALYDGVTAPPPDAE